MGVIDFNMLADNERIYLAIAGGKESHQKGMILELKECVKAHKEKLGECLSEMIRDSQNKIDNIENDQTFSILKTLKILKKMQNGISLTNSKICIHIFNYL